MVVSLVEVPILGQSVSRISLTVKAIVSYRATLVFFWKYLVQSRLDVMHLDSKKNFWISKKKYFTNYL